MSFICFRASASVSCLEIDAQRISGCCWKSHEVSKESQSVLDISMHSLTKLFILSISDLHSIYGKLLKLFSLKCIVGFKIFPKYSITLLFKHPNACIILSAKKTFAEQSKINPFGKYLNANPFVVKSVQHICGKK